MKRFAVRSLAFALALAAGTVAAQDYYDDRGPIYDDGYAGQDDGYYGDDSNDYGQPDDGYYNQPTAYADPRGNYAGYGANQAPAYDVARVVSVDPIVQPGQPVTRQQCWNEPAPSYAYQDRRDPRYTRRTQTSGGGALLGAIAGGVLGNTVGDGDGRRAATVIGAVLGGSIGNNIERNGNDSYAYRPQSVGYARDVQRCRVVTSRDRDERVVGYRVGYEYAGRRYQTVTDYHPGSEIRVRVDVSPAG
ncbi:MAG: hypothetical protein DCF27_07950 [Lysobacteraceae bacterium]|nr:MAG: hypothetical protein DCF27_07950 [Xanthomonadaceae bacterium]